MTDVSAASETAAVTAALRHSHDRLRSLVEPMSAEQLSGRSYATEWSIAQVLSHLGSAAEIFELIFGAGLRGEDPPGRQAITPIWDTWNAKSPQAQAGDALAVDATLVERLEALTTAQLQGFVLRVFGREFAAAGFMRTRLSEHAVHTWDVAVALDTAATLAPDAVDQLVDSLSLVASHSGKPLAEARRVRIVTTAPQRQFVVDAGDSVALLAADEEEGLPTITLPAEAFIRLVYGRLDPQHTPQLETHDDVDLDELRAIFPGV
jgi:uncharacterized protein (TIGR03083 family)